MPPVPGRDSSGRSRGPPGSPAPLEEPNGGVFLSDSWERGRIRAYEPFQGAPDPAAGEREPILPEREPGNRPDGEPGNELLPPDAEGPPRRREGGISDPDCRVPGDEAAATAPGVPDRRPGKGTLPPNVSPPGRREGVVSDPDR
jgi:hypothetical protein